MLINLYTPNSKKPVKQVERHGKLRKFSTGWINSHGTLCFATFNHESNSPSAYCEEYHKVRMISRKKRTPRHKQAAKLVIAEESALVLPVDALELAAMKRSLRSEV